MSARVSGVPAAPLLLAALLAAGPLRAQVPGSTAYDGYLEEEAVPVTGAITVSFEIYTSDVGGSLVWSDTFYDVSVDQGHFSVDLGSHPDALLSGQIFSGAPLWLAVSINGELLAPRTAITTVPYAFRAGVAARADAVSWSAVADVPADIADGDADTHLSQATVEGYIANDVDTGYLPYDNGSKLVSSNVFFDGTNVGVGTETPGSALDVAGAVHASTSVGAPELCIAGTCRASWPSDTRCDTAGRCAEVCVGDTCRSTWPVDGLTACGECDSRFLQSETDPNVSSWAKGGSCSCGTCWATRLVQTDCSNVHWEMCTPAGWKQTSISGNNCP